MNLDFMRRCATLRYTLSQGQPCRRREVSIVILRRARYARLANDGQSEVVRKVSDRDYPALWL